MKHKTQIAMLAVIILLQIMLAFNLNAHPRIVCQDTDVNSAGRVNVIDVQLVINDFLSGEKP